MPPPSHAVIRRAYRAFAGRDLERLRELASPEIEIRTVTAQLAEREAPYRGHDGVAQYLVDVAEVWDELELLPGEFHDLGEDRVLVLGRARARRGTALIDAPNAWLWRVREGKVVSVQLFTEPDMAVALLDS